MSHAFTSDVLPDAGVDDLMADFASAVADGPDRIAVVHDGTAVTYRELAERIHHVAWRARAHRLAAGSSGRIGATVSHTPAVVEHLLGILEAGATYCPIDDALPDGRKRALAEVLELDCVHGLVADACDAVPESLRDVGGPTEPGTSWRPSDGAYVLCTSGSTGVPKPVVISRLALTTTVRSLRQLFALTPRDRVLQFASLGWDTCLEEILPALTTGAALIFDDEAHSGSFPRFLRMVAERRITVLDLPTAFWHELVLFLHEERVGLPDTVRLVVIGGERVDPTRLRQWRESSTGDVVLLNTYGCTETTMITHSVTLAGPGAEPGLEVDGAEAPLGRPLPHVRDHVTDDGELLVSGPCLASGYLGLAELTAAGFPILDHGSGDTRWFRTGDLVVRGQRGLLHSRGRVDDQVKVSGVRVHPAEVEAQLTTHPAVAAAVVMGERRLAQTSLTAYVVTDGSVTSAELKRHLRDRLPSQFVPRTVKFVEALEYTSSGKIDRAATQRAATANQNEGAIR
ncbi:AMP-binding protein [Mycolicibacterium sp. 050158]|uniref:AMP-binding protein n=1 Tax=Mycolicibacterium sp. 050158 TaxID=3090602 RepID=UPI00299E69CD|nr:AMP-binding protein [Mycolicibacterium sp. 050158]MDX1889953.1 AMP-binding protein [Mycolicibacterium sp. 050158]